MGELLIKPYEISVWEDKLTQNGFEEKKLAIIGSDTMTGPNKVYEPVFTKKTNGEKTLTFSLKYKYFDPYIGADGVVNPFAALLINERKVKLHYDNQWYEFIIKDHSESSDGLIWTYTCIDAFVLELSKNGYNITFDSELNNNQGTARELAKKTLENTDWRLGGAEIGKQLIAEPIYKATLSSITGINIINTSEDGTPTPAAGSAIYLFYTYVKNQDGKFVQFIIRDNNRRYAIDDKNVITDTNFRITTELTYKNNGFYLNNTKIISIGDIETQYQANRLAYGQLTTYDPIMGRTVDRFKMGDREVYKYTDYTYTTSDVVMNYIVNGDNFNTLEDGSLQGWNPYVDSTDTVQKLELVTKPELGTNKALVDITKLSQIEGFLKVHFNGALTLNYENAIFNDGIHSNTAFIKSISQGDKFLFRWRAAEGTINNLQSSNNLRLIVAKYTQDDPTRWGYYYKHIDPNNIVLQFEGTPQRLNNIIKGGYITTTTDDETGQTVEVYMLNDVAQEPSTKYVYINSNNNKSYFWDGEHHSFVEVTNNNYRPYYYLTATAQKAVSNTTLTDPSQRYGIFIYTDSDAGDYFIQDIQLTRYIEDANGEPVLIGNIPTATSNPTEYYYLKPSSGSAAEDIETYTSIEALQEGIGSFDPVVPLYNENSEKNLSISVSQSNCFNILQTIAETFECWVDLIVEHDNRGSIIYDTDGPRKFVYLKEYVGHDNYAGFKYGVNVQSIERTINSDEIVTKLIVDQSQSDYTDEGYVSIANAPSNPSGESYILNFDYYYNQELLNRTESERDRIAFVENLTTINNSLKALEKKRRDLEATVLSLESKLNVFTELIETAKDTKSQAIEDFEYLTGQTYEAYRQTHTSLDADDQLTEEETVLETLGNLYNSSAVINNYAGLLTNIESEYEEKENELYGYKNYNVKVWVDKDELNQRHVFVELNDYLPGVGFTLGTLNQESTISIKYWDIVSEDTQLLFVAPNGYTISQSTYNINDNKVAKFKIISSETTEGIEDQIEDLIEQKTELINEFENKYRRFISEGTWNSTDYIDSERYYLDALQVSNTSAQPTVSYSINVVEISQLEGFEDYLFDAGDKTYIEDTEFFGWANVDGVLTPAREEVIVSEVEWHLDEPDQNVITVQNYKTRFEDLFQRISAAVQTVQYNEATYAKITSLLDANGTINQDVLLAAMNNLAGKEYSLTSDGSIQIHGDEILIQNLNNMSNRMVLNSEGLRISSDGGRTWTTAIDGRGINIGTVYTGKLNTDQIVIGSETNPSFRWDKSGISAYKSHADIETGADVYDLQTFVRYDQYGLYGIKNNSTFKASSLNDVKNKAHFAVTWDGFFIRNSYTNGRVEITSDNDFQVIKTVNGVDQERIKIGALEKDIDGEPTKYGIRIKNSNDIETFVTGDDGNITITGTINALGGNFTGLVRVGQQDQDHIKIDGTNASISTSNYQDGAGYGWIINKDGDAVFNNITARGAIKTAVFEYAEIQAVGGVFIFRPSSTIKSARVENDDLIVRVEKPLLFAKVTYKSSNDTTVNNEKTYYQQTNYGYEEIENPVGNPKTNGYYEKSEISHGSWCKISNYTSEGNEPQANVNNILLTNGLTHVYEVSNVNSSTGEITLSGGAAFIDAIRNDDEQTINDILTELEGGALIDMGRKDGSSNYGIGVNSSDNTVNLPARALTLFETQIDETRNPKVSYNYRGIFGTLPHLQYEGATPQVGALYNNYLKGTQGIFTDNIYIGNDTQYLAFYTDANQQKHLKIRARDIVFDVDPTTGQETTWEDKIDEIVYEGGVGQDSIEVKVTSTAGDRFLNGDISTTLICQIFKGGTREITQQFNQFTWRKKDKQGQEIIEAASGNNLGWPRTTSANYITITNNDVNRQNTFSCEVVFTVEDDDGGDNNGN